MTLPRQCVVKVNGLSYLSIIFSQLVATDRDGYTLNYEEIHVTELTQETEGTFPLPKRRLRAFQSLQDD